jgi:hypothetical protein
MGKTVHYGSKGNRVALQDRINRHVLHRGTAAHFDAMLEQQAFNVAVEVTREVMGRQVRYCQPSYRSTAPGFGSRLLRR